jgi:hypothetical protein
MNCKKCGRPLSKCTTCDGQSKTSMLGDRLSCRECDSTGYQCPEHKGYWK